MAPQSGAPPFTAFGTNAPGTASFASLISSLMNDGSSQTIPVQTTEASTTQTAQVVSTSATSASQVSSTFSTSTATIPSSTSSSRASTMISTTSTSPSPGSSALVSSPTSSSTSTATNAASNSNGTLSESEACHSVSCSPGLKAAIAVPVVVGVLAILALIFFLIGRRKRTRRSAASGSEKARKNWTRHLRIFSFDNEILGGGRYSGSNSMRSGPSSDHVQQHQQAGASLQSVEDAAPPYRAAAGAGHSPDMTQVGSGLAAGALTASAVPRSTSRISAPPPYGPVEGRPQSSSEAPVSGTRDPFSDPSPSTHPAILVDGRSPFSDPSEDGSSTRSRPMISRGNSSIRTGLEGDDQSALGGSDAGSIHDAQVGRHVSVASGGRTITNIRNSQSPTNSETNMPT